MIYCFLLVMTSSSWIIYFKPMLIRDGLTGNLLIGQFGDRYPASSALHRPNWGKQSPVTNSESSLCKLLLETLLHLLLLLRLV